MPLYDAIFVMKAMPRPNLVESLMKASRVILERRGIIRKMESLGERRLPQATKTKGAKHTHGHYFIVTCDLPEEEKPEIKEEFSRNPDIVRLAFDKTARIKHDPVCTLEDELKPPKYRPSVAKLIEEGRRPPRYRQIFKSGTGLDYYPFLK